MFHSKTSGWIGLDLGSHCIKLAQVRKRRQQFELQTAVIVHRQSTWQSIDWRQTGDRSSANEIAAAKELAGSFDGRRAACVLPLPCYDMHNAPFPENFADPEGFIDETVESLYGRSVEIEYDYWLTPDPSRDGLLEANTLAISSERALATEHDCRCNRLRLEALDGYPLALARSVTMLGPTDNPQIAVDFGYVNTNICVVQNEMPIYVRTLRNCSLERWVKRLQDELNLTLDEAESLLHRHGLPNAELDSSQRIAHTIAEILAEPLSDFIEEMNRTVTYLSSQRRLPVIQRIVLLGGGSCIQSFAPCLQDQLKIPTERWSLRGASGIRTRNVELPASLFALAAATSVLAWQEVAA